MGLFLIIALAMGVFSYFEQVYLSGTAIEAQQSAMKHSSAVLPPSTANSKSTNGNKWALLSNPLTLYQLNFYLESVAVRCHSIILLKCIQTTY